MNCLWDPSGIFNLLDNSLCAIGSLELSSVHHAFVEVRYASSPFNSSSSSSSSH